ncbi:MAG TPA: hypothetical protein VIL48_06125 [Acidimicrobiales bacterium]
MPDKRQTAKQRRAARNRAAREALIARRENAKAERARARQAAPGRASASAGGGKAAAGAGRAGGDGQPAPGIAGKMYGRPPGVGDNAVLMALFFAVLAAALSVYVAFTSEVIPVDHAGDPLGRFPAISRQAHAILTDTEPVTDKVSLIDAYGPVMAIFALLPALILVGVFISHRREVRSRPLTFGLVALALVSVFNGFFAIYFLPSLIALAVAGFQVRKTELPAREAARGARGRSGAGRAGDEDDDVIDVEEVDEADADETDDADLDEVDEADEQDEDADDEADGDEHDDVLGELEAELAAEDVEADGADEGVEEAEAGRARRRGAGGRSSRR